MKPATLSQARAAKAKVVELMKGSDAVNGVGIARQGAGYAVKLNLVRPAKTDAVPSRVDGVPVMVEVVGQDVIVRQDERLASSFHEATDRAGRDPKVADGDPRFDRPVALLVPIVALHEVPDEPHVRLALRHLHGSLDVRAPEKVEVLHADREAIVTEFLARSHAEGDRRLDTLHVRLATRRQPIRRDRIDVQPAACFT